MASILVRGGKELKNSELILVFLPQSSLVVLNNALCWPLKTDQLKQFISLHRPTQLKIHPNYNLQKKQRVVLILEWGGLAG